MSDSDPELSRLYREASTEGPPAAVDAAILAAARGQVKPPRRVRASWVRWMAPASALATLVVAVSLAFLVERERPETVRDIRIHPITPPPVAAPERATQAVKPKAADGAAPAAAAKKEAPASGAPVFAPAAPLPAQAPAAAAPATETRPAEPAPPAAQAFPAERRAKAAESAVAAPAAAESKTLRESNITGDAARRGAETSAPAAAGGLAPLRQPAPQRSPEAWLDEIVRLRLEGRDKEAAEQLAEFRKAYPAYAVPEELRALH